MHQWSHYRIMSSEFVPFPLLSLPELAIHGILEQMNAVDLIDFSLISSKCKRLVQRTKHGIDGIELSVMINNSMILLKSGDEPRGFVDFNSTVLNEFFMRSINGSTVYVCTSDNFYYCQESVPGTLLKLMSEYLMDIFSAPLHISLHSDGIPVPMLLNGIEKCETLTVSGLYSMHPMDLGWLLETVKPNGKFTLRVRHHGRFYPPEVPLFFDVDHLEMFQTAEWITRGIFLRLCCKRIYLSFCYLKAMDFEHFVAQWYHSERNVIEYVEVWHKVIPNWMRLQNFNPLAWNPNRRAKYFNRTPYSYIDCSSGYDLIRKDGRIGTIIQTPRSFHFIVWNELYPLLNGNLMNLY